MNRKGGAVRQLCPYGQRQSGQIDASTDRRWKLHHRTDLPLDEIARWVRPVLSGWTRYYGYFYPSALRGALRTLDAFLVRWAQRKYRRLRNRCLRAWAWLARVRARQPRLFAHWVLACSVAR